MYRLFLHNGNLFYAKNEYVERNSFLKQKANTEKTPDFASHKNELPLPIWDGHDDTVKCYLHVAEKAFDNFKSPIPESGMISPFIDTAFNGNLFMWDSAFNVMYGRYFCRVADFQTTLDNFYARQHHDGFICRELSETEAGDRFSRDDPGSKDLILWHLLSGNIIALPVILTDLAEFLIRFWDTTNGLWKTARGRTAVTLAVALLAVWIISQGSQAVMILWSRMAL